MDQVTGSSAGRTEEGDVEADGAGSGRVLLAMRNGEVPPRALNLAVALARGRGRSLLVVDAIRLSRAAPLTPPTRFVEREHDVTAAVVEHLDGRYPDLAATGSVHLGHDLARIVADAVESNAVRVVVVDESWRESLPVPLSGAPVEALHGTIECPVVVPTGGPVPDRVSSLLVPVAGGDHWEAQLEVAGGIAAAHRAWIDLLHVCPSDDRDARRAGAERLEDSQAMLAPYDRVDTWLLEADRVEDAIVEQSAYYESTVIGGPQRPRLRRAFVGSTASSIEESSENSVVTVWGNRRAGESGADSTR